MSLINDALKRAKETHGEAPPPTASPTVKTPLRPVESTPRKGIPVWPFVVVILLGLGMFLIGQSTRKTVTASSNPPTETVPPPVKSAPEPGPVAVPQAPAPVAVKPVVTPETTAPVAPVQAPAVVAETAPTPAPATFKLQSIIFDPRRPSATVSGKLLFVGDRISGFRVTAIQKNRVILVNGGQTNVLELEN